MFIPSGIIMFIHVLSRLNRCRSSSINLSLSISCHSLGILNLDCNHNREGEVTLLISSLVDSECAYNEDNVQILLLFEFCKYHMAYNVMSTTAQV